MRSSRLWAAVAALAAFGGAAVAAASLAATWPLARLPQWDGAGNGWGALEVWAALADGRLVDLVVRLNAQDKWPFGFSLLALPFVAAGGGSFASATLLPALAFALVPPLLLWLAREVDPEARGLAAGIAAAALWLTSPLARAFATIVMRETAGAALAVAVAAAYLRARRLGTLGAWRLAGALALALFLTKYNYFLLTGLPLALLAIVEMGAEARRNALHRLADAILRRGWRSPTRWIALVVLVSLASLAFGQNPGGLIYGALVIGFVPCLSLQWKSFRLWREHLAAIAPAPRALFETLLLPLWLWSLSPDPIHPRNLIAFLRNRPGDLPHFSLESLLAPFRGFTLELVATPATATVVALLALGETVRTFVRREPAASGRRAVALSALVGALLVAAHPMKDPRFLLTVVPFVFLAATIALADLAGALRPALLARGALALIAGASSIAAVTIPFGPASVDRVLNDHRRFTVDARLVAPLDEIARRLRAEPGGAFLGATNELSEALVRWRAFASSGEEALFPAAPRGLDSAVEAAEVDRRVAEWLERERPERIVALAPLAGSPWETDLDFLRYNAWQTQALGRLEREGGWRATKPERFTVAGFSVETWIRAGESR